jgi:outer membrane protein OmpA-like peptidoglycan-associated protein
MDAKFDLLQRGQYETTVQAGYEAPAVSSRIPLSLLEARNAMEIVKAAGGEKYAAASFQKAAELLKMAESYLTQKGDKKEIDTAAREAVQTAEDARIITVKRREEERLAQERQAAADREAQAKAQAEASEKARLEAQLAAEHAAREKAEAEAARAAAEAQQQAAQADADRARKQADDARREAEDAERARKQAEAEKGELRKRLLDQLNSVLQTQDTARGLIVNMSDVLFDTGKYTLQAAAREKLAKISGIVLAHPGLNLEVEGHTDNVGSAEFNQLLSEQRAAAVQEFLVQQGLPESSVTSRGFGMTQPVATNDTPEGRAKNRRVELVVTGEGIGGGTEAPAVP